MHPILQLFLSSDMVSEPDIFSLPLTLAPVPPGSRPLAAGHRRLQVTAAFSRRHTLATATRSRHRRRLQAAATPRRHRL
jgi:hypothetical protein